MKLSQKVLNGLGNKKVPPTKPKAAKVVDGVTYVVKKARKKIGGGHLLRLNVPRRLIVL